MKQMTIEGRAFWRYRLLLSAMIDQAVEKMLATDTADGSVTGKIEIRIDKEVDGESGEVIIKPRFTFKTDMSVPVKAAEKMDSDGELLLIRDQDGRLAICDNQISVDEL